MKTSFLSLIIALASLSACQSSNTNSTKSTDTVAYIVGNDQDTSGCVTSAGYVWSQIKETCIQPWEEGLALLEVDSSNTYQKSAYILIDSAGKKAEIFMTENNLVLPETADNVYSNGDFNLVQEDNCWIISLNDKPLYQESTM